MHGKYSFVETLIERLIQQVRKHEKQVKAYDKACTAMRYGNDGLTQRERGQLAANYAATVGAVPESTPERTARLKGADANPERRGNGCMVYRVNS